MAPNRAKYQKLRFAGDLLEDGCCNYAKKAQSDQKNLWKMYKVSVSIKQINKNVAYKKSVYSENPKTMSHE